MPHYVEAKVGVCCPVIEFQPVPSILQLQHYTVTSFPPVPNRLQPPSPPTFNTYFGLQKGLQMCKQNI